MIDITKIPTAELLKDKLASEEGATICREALMIGITHHKDGLPVQERLDTEIKIMAIIENELNRRGACS